MLDIKLKQKIRALQLHSLFCFYLMSEDVRTKTKTFDTHITNFFYYDRLSIEFKPALTWIFDSIMRR